MLPFERSGLAPAVVIVHPDQNWAEYGTLLTLTDPFSEEGWQIVYTRGTIADMRVERLQPQLRTYHYYPEQPNRFYREQREN